MNSKLFPITIIALSLIGCSKGNDSSSNNSSHFYQKEYNINTEEDVSDKSLKHYTIMHGDSELNNSNKEVTINWDFGDGSEKVSGHEVMASHKYNPGSYIVEAVLINNDNSSIGIQEEIDVIDEYVTTPIITYSYIDNNRSKLSFRTTNVNNSNDAYIYVWNFGDGITSTSEKNTINHTYTTYGTYKVSVVIKNKKHENISVSEKKIEIKNPVFKITCNSLVSNDESNPISCKPYLTDDPIGAVNDISIEWKFNNKIKKNTNYSSNYGLGSTSIFSNNLNSINHEIYNEDSVEIIALLRSSKFGYDEFGEKKGVLSNIETIDFTSMYKISNIECKEVKNNLGEGKTDYLDLSCAAKYINKGNTNSQMVPNISNNDLRWNITVDKKHNIEVNNLNIYDIKYEENGTFNDEVNVPVVTSKIKLPKYLKDDFYKISLSVPAQENKLDKKNKDNVIDSEKSERLVSSLEFKTKYPCIKNVEIEKGNIDLFDIENINHEVEFNGKINLGYLNEDNQCIESLAFRDKEVNFKNKKINRSNISEVYESINSNSLVLNNELSDLEEDVIIPSDLVVKTRIREKNNNNLFEEFISNKLNENPFKIKFGNTYNFEYVILHNSIDKNGLSYKDEKEYSIFERVESHIITPRLSPANSYNVFFDTDLKLLVGLNETSTFNVNINKSKIYVNGEESNVIEENSSYINLPNTKITYDITAETKSPYSNKVYSVKTTYKNNPLRIYSVKITGTDGDSKVYYSKNNNETIVHTANILRDKKYDYTVEVKEVREYVGNPKEQFIPKNYNSLLRQGFSCSSDISNSEKENNNYLTFETGTNNTNIYSCYSESIKDDSESSEDMFYKHKIIYNANSKRLDGDSDKYNMSYKLESKNTNSMGINLVFDFKYTN